MVGSEPSIFNRGLRVLIRRRRLCHLGTSGLESVLAYLVSTGSPEEETLIGFEVPWLACSPGFAQTARESGLLSQQRLLVRLNVLVEVTSKGAVILRLLKGACVLMLLECHRARLRAASPLSTAKHNRFCSTPVVVSCWMDSFLGIHGPTLPG